MFVKKTGKAATRQNRYPLKILMLDLILINNDKIKKLTVFLIAGTAGFCTEAILIRVGISVSGVDPITARAFSFPVAVLVTWYVNRTYGYRISAPPTIGELVKYFKTNFISQSVNLSIFAFLTWRSPFFQRLPELALVVGTSVSIVLSFLLYDLFVFKNLPDTKANKEQRR